MKHPSRYAYNNGCRCDGCRKENADYTRRRKQTPAAKAARSAYMKKYRKNRPPPTPEEREANNAYMREYRRRRAAEDPEYRAAQTAASRRRRERRRYETELELGLLGDSAFEPPFSSDN